MANYSFVLRRVVRESKVLARADHHLEALVVDERPEALVAELVQSHVGVHQLYTHSPLDLERRAVWSRIMATVSFVEEPRSENIFVGAVGWRISQHRT